MSLYPGGRFKQPGNVFIDSVDTNALADSLALAIENELKKYHQSIKGKPLPAVGEKDRRILFVAIARGVLGYLSQKQAQITVPADGGVSVNMNVNMNEP